MTRVIIVEDDYSTAKLLSQLVRNLWPEAKVKDFRDGASALQYWQNAKADLLLLDWELPGMTGIDLLKEIRHHADPVPCVMVTGHAERDRIIEARRYQVSAYIIKPFRARDVMARLSEALQSTTTKTAPKEAAESLPKMVEYHIAEGLLSVPITPTLIRSLEGAEKLEKGELETVLRRCQLEPALIARLLALANSTHYNDGEVFVETFAAAFDQVGIDVLINVAMTLSLQPGNELTNPLLETKRRALLNDSLIMFKLVNTLGQRLKFDVKSCRAACMLYRLGELALLPVMQKWFDMGNALSESDCDDILKQRSADASYHLKMQWGIPVPIRNRVGAAYLLPSGTVKTDSIIMRIAGLVQSKEDEAEFKRLMARLGLAGQTLEP